MNIILSNNRNYMSEKYNILSGSNCSTMPEYKIKGYASYSYDGHRGECTMTDNIENYSRPVDVYRLERFPVIYFMCMMVVNAFHIIAMLMPFLTPFSIVFNQGFVLIGGLSYIILTGFCGGYFKRKRQSDTSVIVYRPNIAMQIQWYDKVLYKTDGYILPHMYNCLPLWVFSTYQLIENVETLLTKSF